MPLAEPSVAGQTPLKESEPRSDGLRLETARDVRGKLDSEVGSMRVAEEVPLASEVAVKSAQEPSDNGLDKTGRVHGPNSIEGKPQSTVEKRIERGVENTVDSRAKSGAHANEIGEPAWTEIRATTKGADASRDATPLELPGGHVADGGASSPSFSSPHSRGENSKESPKGTLLANGSLAAANAAAERLQRTLAEHVAAPRTSYEFEAQWKGFKDDSAAKAKLLKVSRWEGQGLTRPVLRRETRESLL